MNFSDEWETFTQALVARAVGNYRNSEEYTYYRHRTKDIDELLSNSLCEDEKELVDKILFELDAAADRETEVVYRQGLRDGVFILKSLGMLV